MASIRRHIGGRRIPAVVAIVSLALGSGCARQAPADPASGSDIQFPADWAWSADVAPVTAQNGMVATVDDYATQAGLQVLEDGGNAVDAAVTVSLVLAVTHSSAGNIGGGGFMVLRNADGTTAALDYREKAPLKASHDMYLDENGKLTNKSLLGPLAVGVPGSVAGLWKAHQRYGKTDWAKLVQPAIDLADGYVVREEQHRMIAGSADAIRDFPTTASIFLPGGDVPAVGDTLHQADLAATLRRIQKDGPDDFYKGKTADLIVAEMEKDGGLITRQDLEQYEAKWQDPVQFSYR
ncbi:MAG TPA: gamma-glutamyltransferase, partial [Gemmatimonadota bacterium]|nr:gamma-glutamyltransferase [Gemmatimonadota bacterium]